VEGEKGSDQPPVDVVSSRGTLRRRIVQRRGLVGVDNKIGLLNGIGVGAKEEVVAI